MIRRLPRWAVWSCLALWAALSFVVQSTLMASHWYTLPSPDRADPALEEALAALVPEAEQESWTAVHVLYSACRCSQRVFDHLEDGMAESGRVPEAGLVTELAERWQRLLDSVVVVLDSGTRDSILVRPEQYRALLEKSLAGPAESELTPLLLELRLEQTQDRLERVGDQATRIASRLGKGELVVEVESSELQLDPLRWAPFWQDFVHIVRNAVDHGIESEEEGLGRGKPAAGMLWLSTRLENDEFVVQVRDDGRGIDWSRVRLKAEERGLPVETRADLEAALFFEGFTTSEQVTAYSGRGVGLSAVRAATEARSGQISVSSQLGQGTTFEFRFPASQMAPSPQELLVA